MDGVETKEQERPQKWQSRGESGSTWVYVHECLQPGKQVGETRAVWPRCTTQLSSSAKLVEPVESIFKNRQDATWGNQKSFHHYICIATLNKKNIEALPDGAGDVVTADTDKAGVVSFFFAPVFSCKVSQASVVSEKVQGWEPAVDKDQVRD